MKYRRISESGIILIDGDRGKNYPSANEFYDDEYCLFLDASNVTEEGFNFSSTHFITKEKDSILRAGKLQRNDIVLTTRGSVGNIALYDENVKYDNVRINSGMIILRSLKIDTKVLYYCLKSPFVKQQISNYMSGSVQKQLTASIINELKILDEEIDISIIDDINKKISNNNKIINELESMAKTLYDYWFLQFEFPNQEGKPYKSSGGKMIYNEELKREIPEGWKVENIMESSLCSDIKAGVDKFESKNYLPTANIEGESITDGEDITFDNRENRANMQPVKYSVWFAKMKNSIKHLSIPENSEWFTSKYILSTGFQGLKCTQTTFAYIHSIINSSWFETYKDILSHGATQEGVNNEDLKNIKYVVPSNNVLIEFNKICMPALEKKFSIIRENQELVSLRDFLLPMLMNGQVTFGED